MQKTKRRGLLFITLFLTFSANINAQDLLVKTNGDSLNCKIMDIKKGIFYIKMLENQKVVDKKINETEVKKHTFYYFSVVPDFPLFSGVSYKGNFPNHRIATNLGYDFFIKGMNIDLNYTYYFVKWLGVGLRESFTLGFPRRVNIYEPVSSYLSVFKGGAVYKSYSNFLTVHIAPRFFLNKSKMQYLFAHAGLGLSTEINKNKYLGEYSSYINNDLGFYFALGYDFSVSDKVSLGVKPSFSFSLSDKYFETAQLILSFGLRFNK